VEVAKPSVDSHVKLDNRVERLQYVDLIRMRI
jgi:hypothetical protein